nr:ABC transporter permease [Cellvibrionaceae bacterium]
IPDIHFRSLKFGVRDNVYLLNPQRFRAATISYHNAELPKLIAKIESLWRELAPQQPVKLQFLSEMIAAQYRSEYIQTKMFSAFSLLAVLLACLGLYGLISFATQRRTREIGIRKVLGAGVGDIVGLLVWQLSKPVLFANVVAWPAVWIFMTRWLSGFNYRIEWYWIIVAALLASLLCVVIAWLTVGVNAAIAASAKPVKALRYE